MAQVSLSPVTPVHVGTGEMYSQYEFFKSRHKDTLSIVRINQEEFFSRLSDEEYQDLLGRMETSWNDSNLTQFIKDKKLSVQGTERYRCSYLRTPEAIPQIREFTKTADTPYIPGSTVKGAIRTALLWNYARDNPGRLREAVMNELRGKRINTRFFLKSFEEEVFAYYSPKGRADAKYDLMKFVLVTDFSGRKDSLEIRGIKTYSLRNGRMAPKNYVVFCEMAPGQSVFSGDITLSPQYSAAAGPGREGESRLRSRMKEIFGLTGAFDDSALADAIRQALHDFTAWSLVKEKRLADTSGFTPLDSACTDIMAKNTNGCLFKIGFGTGTIFQTLMPLIEEIDADLSLEILQVLRLGKNDKIHRQVVKGEIAPPYPKSVELIDNPKEREQYQSPGWVEWT